MTWRHLTQPLTEMSIRNISWRVRQPVRRADDLTTFMRPSSWNLGASTSWNPQGLSRTVRGFHFIYLFVHDTKAGRPVMCKVFTISCVSVRGLTVSLHMNLRAQSYNKDWIQTQMNITWIRFAVISLFPHTAGVIFGTFLNVLAYILLKAN